jgi:hypothetical protein
MGVLSKILDPSRSNSVYRGALKQACSSLSDAEAREQLRELVAETKRGGRGALRTLKTCRAEYHGDRAHRLLSAVLEDRPVEPAPADKALLFGREERLGHLPLRDAFAVLKDLEPRLASLEQDGQSIGRSPKEGVTPDGQLLNGLVGPLSAHPDELMRTQLALSIAAQYIAIISGSEQLGDGGTSYFESPRKKVVRAGGF